MVNKFDELILRCFFGNDLVFFTDFTVLLHSFAGQR